MGIQVISDIPLDQARNAIYAIMHESGRVYVGRTTGTVDMRWRQHLKEAFRGTRSNTYIANALRKYGAHTFDVIALAHGIAPDALQAQEALYIAALEANVPGKGFNLTAGGEASPSSDPRVREKIRTAQTGRRLTPEWRAKVGAAQLGRKKSAEAVAKWVAKRRGMKFSPEWRAALSEAHKGHKHSDETRAKMSASNVARHAATGIGKQQGEKMRPIMKALWANPEWRARTIERMREAKPAELRARVYSDETRKKLSAAARKRWGG